MMPADADPNEINRRVGQFRNSQIEHSADTRGIEYFSVCVYYVGNSVRDKAYLKRLSCSLDIRGLCPFLHLEGLSRPKGIGCPFPFVNPCLISDSSFLSSMRAQPQYSSHGCAYGGTHIIRNLICVARPE